MKLVTASDPFCDSIQKFYLVRVFLKLNLITQT